MPNDKKEPQSYGSQADWVTGRTGQEVQPQPSAPPADQAEFYDSRRDSEGSAPEQGGRTSEVQSAETSHPASRVDDGDGPIPRVTSEDSGAKRDSYFRKRDYE